MKYLTLLAQGFFNSCNVKIILRQRLREKRRKQGSRYTAAVKGRKIRISKQNGTKETAPGKYASLDEVL